MHNCSFPIQAFAFLAGLEGVPSALRLLVRLARGVREVVRGCLYSESSSRSNFLVEATVTGAGSFVKRSLGASCLLRSMAKSRSIVMFVFMMLVAFCLTDLRSC